MLTKSLFINIFIFRLNRHRQFTPLSFQRLCFSVCLFPINVRTAEPIVPKFCVGPHLCPQGRLMIDRNFKISLLTKFNFHKIFKIHETFVWNLRTFFVIVFYNVHKEKMFTIEIEYGRKAPWKPYIVTWYLSYLHLKLKVKLHCSDQQVSSFLLLHTVVSVWRVG